MLSQAMTVSQVVMKLELLTVIANATEIMKKLLSIAGIRMDHCYTLPNANTENSHLNSTESRKY